MKNMIFFAAILTFSAPAFAAKLTTICGVNKNGEKIRLEITMEQEDAFSSPAILTIDGQKPKRVSENGASGFGPKGYEHITLKLTNGCNGSASYSHYNEDMPMNPMEDLELKCICK